jgi:fibronectin-binding autotransporter adhesin
MFSSALLGGVALTAVVAATSGSRAGQFDVTNANDSGPGSLRAAIAGSDSLAGPNAIVFQSVWNIPLQSALPDITNSVTFQAPNSNPVIYNFDGTVPILAIDSGGSLALDSTAPQVAILAELRANGAFDISNGATSSYVGTLAGSGTVTLGGNRLVILQASTEFSGSIGGASGGVEIQAGTQTLSGVNTYTGPTQIDAGATLALRGGGSMAASSYVGFVSGGAGDSVFDISLTTAGAIVQGLAAADASAIVSLGSQTLSLSGNVGPFAGIIEDGGIGGGVGGAVTVLRGGVATFEGANAYTGLTTINAGGELDLMSSGGQNGSIATSRGLVNNGTFDISGLANGVASIVTLSGTTAGQINLGSNVLVLTNAAGTFSGVIADGGNSGGTGGRVEILKGKEIFSGANTYTGGTFVAGGATIGVGSNSALGANTLTLQDGATLSFEANGLDLPNNIAMPGRLDPVIDTGANNATISGIISGPGALTKAGTGALDLTAANTYTGATLVSAGTLVVDGSIASSASLTLSAATTIGGSGTVPGFLVPAGASVAPGAATAFSTLHVAGAIGFLPGSTYVVNINAAGATDRIVSTGAATISGGTVNVLAAGGVYSASTRYTILTAAGGLSGAFASLTTTSNLAFLTPGLSYDADNAYLGFTAKVIPPGTPGAPPTPVTFPSVALTPNQKASAGATQLLGPGNRVYDVVLGQTVAGARAAFDALSGENHPSAISGAFEDSRLPREAVLDRLASPYGALAGGGFATTQSIAAPSASQAIAAWGQAFGSWGHLGGDGPRSFAWRLHPRRRRDARSDLSPRNRRRLHPIDAQRRCARLERAHRHDLRRSLCRREL